MDIQLTSEQQEMVLKNRGLVPYIVNKLGIPYEDFDDMISIGTIGLIKAVATFDSSKKIKFATYATTCIKNEIFMSLRKSHKYQNVLSLDEIIFENNQDGSELSLKDSISDPKSLDFEKQLGDMDVIAKALNYILNCFTREVTIILLLSIAGVKQSIIADIVGISQSYVSRIIKRNSCKLRKSYEEKNNCKEVFKLDFRNNRFKITFSTANVEQFNTALANFLTKNNNVEELPHFEIDRTKSQVTMYIKAELESLAFIACIIKEIEDFSMSFDGASQISSENDEKGDITVKENHTEVKAEDNTRGLTANAEATDFEEELQVKPSTANLLPKIKNVGLTIENASTAKKTDDTEESSPNSTLSNSEISKQIREYIATKNSFYVNEIKQKFPYASVKLITNILYYDKNKGLISSCKRGYYTVKSN